MRPYLRRASVIIGAILIVLAYRAVKPVCHTVTPETTSSTTPTPIPTPGDTPPPFTTSFGTQVEECITDLRMPSALAVAGVAAIAGGVMFRPKRRLGGRSGADPRRHED